MSGTPRPKQTLHSSSPLLTVAPGEFRADSGEHDDGFPRQRILFGRDLDNPTQNIASRLASPGRRLRPFSWESRQIAFILLPSVALVLACHAALIWLVASAVAHIATVTRVQDIIIAWSGDAVYGRLSLAMVGNIQPLGIGDWLSVMFSSGSSVIGVQTVQLVVDVGMVMGGVAGVMALRMTKPRLVVLVGIGLAYAVGSTLGLSWGNGSGGDMMLAMSATKVLGIDSRLFDDIVQHGRAFSFALDLFLAGCAAGLAGSGILVVGRLKPFRPLNGRMSLSRPSGLLWTAMALTVVAAAVRPAVSFQPSSVPVVLPDAKRVGPTGPVASLPSVVTISPTETHGWQYKVNGHPEVIHGIGYNAVTTGETPAERGSRYDRDFASMSAAGANTVVGWSEVEFDDLLMKKAGEYGLGVVLPFHLGPTYVLSEPDYAYEDPKVRRQLLEAVSWRVEQFRNYPSLRMWGLGNEVLHAIAWAHGSPTHAQAFADFLVEAADRVHQLDPNHPVIYRDAEDWYVRPIINALANNPKPRPWFVYGMNFFTTRLQKALDSGPVTGLAQPLMISEFGPVGLRSEARPAGYRSLWDIIRSHPNRVLGGSAYVWSTVGPEPLDRNFGLTDALGRPVDDSLAELSSLYQSDNLPPVAQ